MLLSKAVVTTLLLEDSVWEAVELCARGEAEDGEPVDTVDLGGSWRP